MLAWSNLNFDTSGYDTLGHTSRNMGNRGAKSYLNCGGGSFKGF